MKMVTKVIATPAGVRPIGGFKFVADDYALGADEFWFVIDEDPIVIINDYALARIKIE